MNRIKRFVFLLPTAFIALVTSFPQIATAHEAKCPFCELDVVQNTPEQDNEVALRYGKKRIEYRCVMCAIADSKNFEGDVTVLAPTEIKGKPALISRKGGVWTAQPDGLVFVGAKVKHRHCQLGYRAFTTRTAFEAHAKKNKVILPDAKPVSLPEMVKIAESYAKE